MTSREDAMETLQRRLAGLISTLEFRPSGEHPEACMPMAAAVLALTQSASAVPVQRDERAEKLGEQLDAMVAEVNANHRIISRLEERVREVDAAWLRHTWPCGHISEGTGDEPDRCRICVAEARGRKAEGERDTWKDCIAEEMVENIKLFNLLGVMPEIEAGRAGTDAVVEAVRKLKADLAAALDALSACHRSGTVLEERARNADALATNLRRLDNERAIEVMHVKRDLAAMDDAVGRLVRAVDAYTDYPSGDAMTEVMSSLSSPVFTMWRRK